MMSPRLMDTYKFVKFTMKVAAIPVAILTILIGPIVIVIAGLNLIAATSFIYFTYESRS